MKKNEIESNIPPESPVKPTGLSEIEDFLWESNAIEQEYSGVAFEDAKSAWDYIADKKIIHYDDVLAVHQILMGRLRQDIAGKFRTCAVKIGFGIKKAQPRAMFVHMLTHCIVKMRLIPKHKNLDRHAKECHIMFEDIHPFEDGNGRTGRLIWLWHRKQLGLPIKIIHADWPKERGEQMSYYSWFKKNGK